MLTILPTESDQQSLLKTTCMPMFLHTLLLSSKLSRPQALCSCSARWAYARETERTRIQSTAGRPLHVSAPPIEATCRGHVHGSLEKTNLACEAVTVAGRILLARDQADAIAHWEHDHVDVRVCHDSLVEGPDSLAALARLPAV